MYCTPTARQVLSDVDARRAYDANGEAAADPGADLALNMFETLFGSASFEPLVGRFPVLEQVLVVDLVGTPGRS